MIVLNPAAPARVVAAVAPLAAIGLVAFRALGAGLASGPDDPASPWLVAVVTIALGCWLGWRARTQRAELRPEVLRCRNLTTTFELGWERAEAVVVSRRGPITVFDVRVRGLRRRLRIGAATRLSGSGADVVIDMIRAHPVAGDLLLDPRDPQFDE